MTFLRSNYFLCLIIVFGCEIALYGASPLRRKTADQVLRNKKAFEGTELAIEGFVRFDRLSQRGFLYRNQRDLQRRDYKKTIFLELGNEGFSSVKIPDGRYVRVTGYLSEDLRGPLGVYPAHVIVQRIEVLRR